MINFIAVNLISEKNYSILFFLIFSFSLLFYLFLLYNIVLVFPYINMNPS